MMFSRIELDFLADIVANAIEARKKAAAALGTQTNTKFLEDLLVKLGGTPVSREPRQNHRRPDQR